MLHLNNVGNSSHRSSILVLHTFDFSMTVKIVYSFIKKKRGLTLYGLVYIYYYYYSLMNRNCSRNRRAQISNMTLPIYSVLLSCCNSFGKRKKNRCNNVRKRLHRMPSAFSTSSLTFPLLQAK